MNLHMECLRFSFVSRKGNILEIIFARGRFCYEKKESYAWKKHPTFSFARISSPVKIHTTIMRTVDNFAVSTFDHRLRMGTGCYTNCTT